MKKKVIQLMAICCLVFVGMLGVDLASQASEDLVLGHVFTPAEAMGCAAYEVHHHEGFRNGTVCYGSSGDPTDFTVLEYDDCRPMLLECCAFPTQAPQCPSLGG